MRISKILLVVAATSLSALAVGCGAHAQDGEPATVAQAGPEAHEEGMHPFLAIDAIELSAPQKEKVAKIRADLQAKLTPAKSLRTQYSDVLAAQVEAGAIDRAKLDAAKAALVAGAAEGPMQDALRELHATLDPAQRKALVDATHERMLRHGRPGRGGPAGHDGDEHAGKHRRGGPDGHDGDEHAGKHRRGGPEGHGQGNPMRKLAKELDLTDAQKQAFKDEMKARHAREGGGDHKAAFDGMREHMKAVADAFVSDKFDPVALGVGKQAKMMAEQGATRSADMAEVAVRILTPEQRTKLAAKIREHKMPFLARPHRRPVGASLIGRRRVKRPSQRARRPRGRRTTSGSPGPTLRRCTGSAATREGHPRCARAQNPGRCGRAASCTRLGRPP